MADKKQAESESAAEALAPSGEENAKQAEPTPGPGVPVLPEEEKPRDHHYNPQPELLHANADYSALVDADSPDAAFVINPENATGRAAELLRKHREAEEPKRAAKDDDERGDTKAGGRGK